MKTIALALATFTLAACQPAPTTAPTVLGPIHTLSASECVERGGKMVAQGRLQQTRCQMTFADAGKVCRDGDDCIGDCRITDAAATPREGQGARGQCQANTSPFGCYTRIEDGQAQPTICVD